MLRSQIKQAQSAEGHNDDAIAEWKAGFIEDAEDLHLAYKPMFLSVIKNWCEDPQVRKNYECLTINGCERYTCLIEEIERKYRKVSSQKVHNTISTQESENDNR